MKTSINDRLFQHAAEDEEKPRLNRPERCGPGCVQYRFCHFPKSCPVLIKTKQSLKNYGDFITRDPMPEL